MKREAKQETGLRTGLKTGLKTTMHQRVGVGVVGVFVVSAIVSIAIADITGSKHDFSPLGWSQNEICKPCHTPHNADTSVEAPLWNHTQTTATYVLYTSPTLSGDIQQPGPASKLCLSCHDGTVALDSYGENAGDHYIYGQTLIGTDLSNDHPVGIKWEHRGVGSNCLDCHNIRPGPGEDPMVSVLPFFEDARIECATCHEPHNKLGIAGMLRMSNDGSALCFHCHDPK